MAEGIASFNQIIESPKFGDKSNSYDLEKVITTSGFEVGVLSYELIVGHNVTIEEGNMLVVEADSYGSIVINVHNESQNASAETELYGFNAKINEYANVRLEAYNNMVSVYPSLLPNR